MEPMKVKILRDSVRTGESCCSPGPETSDSGECNCGRTPDIRAAFSELPGYAVEPFVADFLSSPVGPVPRVFSALKWTDRLGALRVRMGIRRNRYRVFPGLYAVGSPKADSPVLVTANYKLTFDVLRRDAGRLDAWILVVDTRGINVWCAAGKKTFSAEEVIKRVSQSGLSQVVSHRKLILPQLSATGVSAADVKRGCGFSVLWGPVHAYDIPAFLQQKGISDPKMRQVTFTLGERLVLVPVEILNMARTSFWVLLAVFFLSGIGKDVFSLHSAWFRGWEAGVAYLAGIGAGAILVPALLPWIPGRSFYLKGMLASAPLSAVTIWGTGERNTAAGAALCLFCAAVASYLAMNFTGSTPYTGPSGVEKEMRRGIPLQALFLLGAMVLWVVAGFG